ncbi:glycoside hydrolase [Xylariaceae sp. FL0804]|nr:glycoside hydrolase [Xylariaceae sp. FL0804]
MMHRSGALVAGLLLAPLALAQGGLVINPKNADNGAAGPSVPLDLTALRDNRGFAMFPGDADFDGIGSGYPAQHLPPADLTYAGVRFDFPQYAGAGGGGYDNVLARGQTLTPPQPGRYLAVHMLAAAETAIATGTVTATYADNGTATAGEVLVDPFWDWPYPYGGDLVFPSYYSNSSVDYNRSMIFHSVNWLDSSRELATLQLPNVTTGSGSGPGGAGEDTRLHIFAVSLVPAEAAGSGSGDVVSVAVEYARSTRTWLEGTNKTQIVEVTVNNDGDGWVLASHAVRVTVEAAGLRTVVPGVINRLRPGDQTVVQIGVVNAEGTADGTATEATVHVTGNGVQANMTFNATCGIASYEPTFADVYAHEAPPWYRDAKFGIFIHWGLYSVPGWGNSGDNESYAEWYWWDMNEGAGTAVGTYEYNLRTYGPEHVYDDFIQDFTAAVFDPKEWVDLFADAGAGYFVQVSKHHDGYALFDLPANVTQRTSVAQFPHRNLLKELFDAATEHQPQLHKATYFSVPEWFSPAYEPYGFGQWPGGNATNPYTNATLPYTGFVPVDDYVRDVALAQMNALAALGSEILWCDIGGPNLTAEFAAGYFDGAAADGRQVLLDNRCGVPGDFDTPEYARYGAVQRRKWESNLGMDPYSYGYNRATPAAAYLAPADIVASLVDIVSKNGNFLLDIGPTANGTIVQVEQDNLRAAGAWIRDHGEAIYNTTYWSITPAEGDALRFTQTADAFYISALYAPNATLVVDSPVPYVSGDAVTVVGGGAAGTVVPSRLLANGSLQLTVSDEVRDADKWCWVFKIPFVETTAAANGTANSTVTATASGSSGGASQTAGSQGAKVQVSMLLVAAAVMLGCMCL